MKKLLLASALIAATAPSMAEVSLSGGFVSDYYYRGGALGDAGGYAGVEYAAGGFTVGTWAIQDGDTVNGGPTIEYDVYASYGFDVSEDVALSIGYTQYNYNYTGDFESEVNLGAGFGPVALDVAIGTDDDGAAGDTDYNYIAISGDAGPIGLALGSFDLDAAGDTGDYMHLEASAGTEIADSGVALGVTLGHNAPKDDTVASFEYLFLDLSAGFEL